MTDFPTDPAGLPEATGPALLELAGGDTFDLRIGPVAKRLGDTTVRMLGYNGSIPGPTLKVPQGAEVTVDVTNRGDLDATVHWHGLRLENRYDGVPHETQAPIPVGGRFTYRVQFPDPGLYWYHPHIREDYTQELGLYGNIVVVPADPGYWPPVDKEFVLTLDDLLVEDGAIAPFSTTEITHVAMGRYGTVLLVAGETDLQLAADAGDVVRLWLTNTANTRVFDVRLPGARMKLVGGDSGRVEREELVEGVLLAPSERAVVDVLLDRPGTLALEHHTPGRVYRLATVAVGERRAAPSAAEHFTTLREDPELRAERQRLARWVAAPPDKVLALVAEMTGGGGHDHHHGHHGGHDGHHGGHGGHDGHDMGGGGGIEWEDEMAEANRQTTTENMRWRIVDRGTGAADAAIDWRFTVGERVKIRLVNEMASDHPMHHPFHVHGAGRFLVLARDGEVSPNLVWKDTVLIRTGEVVDILLDVTNPGVWMAHCHIAEHMQGGMMFSFTVDRAAD